MKQLMLNPKEALATMMKSHTYIVAIATFVSYAVVTLRYEDGKLEDKYIDYDLSSDKLKVVSHSKTFEEMMRKREIYNKEQQS